MGNVVNILTFYKSALVQIQSNQLIIIVPIFYISFQVWGLKKIKSNLSPSPLIQKKNKI